MSALESIERDIPVVGPDLSDFASLDPQSQRRLRAVTNPCVLRVSASTLAVLMTFAINLAAIQQGLRE